MGAKGGWAGGWVGKGKGDLKGWHGKGQYQPLGVKAASKGDLRAASGSVESKDTPQGIAQKEREKAKAHSQD
eukprot:10849195-Lingulodinium_polyedra.AAC.1